MFSSTQDTESHSKDEVVANRNGQVLLKDTLLKADHFPGCQNTELVPCFEDAPNFRQMPGLPIIGVAIPTVTGLKIILDLLEARERNVLWQNMREEPVLYINGNPYVVRDADKPFANLEYTGIDRVRVEDMERRLKQDVIKESEKYAGQVLLSDENDDLQVVQFWEQIDSNSIQTSLDVFHQLQLEGYNVDYLRIPVTDEKAPKEIDFDLLIQRCWSQNRNTSLIFNCQMGRGRTTTGMIIASLLHLRQSPSFPTDISTKLHTTVQEEKSSSLKQGYYAVVRSLLRVLEHGSEAKSVLDQVIDAANHMQNLREAILGYRERLSMEHNEAKRNSILRVSLEYLERYCVLLAFTVHISHPKFDPLSSNHVTFEQFMKQRPEFKSVLKRMIRRNPMSALGLHYSSTSNQKWKLDGLEFIQNRQGSVLGQNTILKEDHFPGIEDPRLHQPIPGAPNFRGVLDLPVYGVGMPTIEGIKDVLTAIGAGPNQQNSSNALWFNWREEPLVYINGKPFVLREHFRPFKNLKEYGDIDTKRLEKMEERLKNDIKFEASVNDGKVLVALETPSSGIEAGVLADKWELVENEFSVQTPAAVYKQLQSEGYSVHYYRLPLTDGSTPDILDVDRIFHSMKDQGMKASVVFNCQNGAGRTTVGMVIASLVLQGFQIAPFSSQFTPEKLRRISPVQTAPEDDVTWQACAEGRYLGVRRLTRLLEQGFLSKSLLDQFIDCCDLMVNLRTAIGYYRTGMVHQLPEILSRHSTFRRAVGYLHRYCFLIIVAAYLTQSLDPALPFSHWVQSKKELTVALDTVKSSPSDALSVLVPKQLSRSDSWSSMADMVSLENEVSILQSRQYSLLTSKCILKGNRCLHQSSSDLKQVQSRSIYTIGDPSVKTLRSILQKLRDNHSNIYIIDLREELIVYINGKPYTRRDLERPVSSLYQVGVAVEDLERMEETLRRNTCQEVERHHGKVLIHEELILQDSNQSRNQGHGHFRDHITQLHNQNSPTVVARTKETRGVKDLDDGVCTPRDVCNALSCEGFNLHYSRVPLSRQRTPHEIDLDLLWRSSGAAETARCSQNAYLIVSRLATGSSTRFTAAFLTMLEDWFVKGGTQRPVLDNGESKLALGEYRGIMNLCRVLPNGSKCKASVDASIDSCVAIGSLREDILACKYTTISESAEALKLGLHYLKRYFFLIAFRCYLDNKTGSDESFVKWVKYRKELRHLISTMSLE
eukprot:g506.t1